MSGINTYFAQIGEKLANDIPAANINMNYNNIPNIPLLELKHTKPEEVTKYLNAISDSKATGEDGILIRFLKMTHEITSNLL